ncbi:MAG: hypothetical protein K0U84_13575 [Actinomycetia bacterium]|nr:hypothetical protein [Actinomycetes bacterium]
MSIFGGKKPDTSAAERAEARALAQEEKLRKQEEATAKAESQQKMARYKRRTAGRRSLISDEETGLKDNLGT